MVEEELPCVLNTLHRNYHLRVAASTSTADILGLHSHHKKLAGRVVGSLEDSRRMTAATAKSRLSRGSHFIDTAKNFLSSPLFHFSKAKKSSSSDLAP